MPSMYYSKEKYKKSPISKKNYCHIQQSLPEQNPTIKPKSLWFINIQEKLFRCVEMELMIVELSNKLTSVYLCPKHKPPFLLLSLPRSLIYLQWLNLSKNAELVLPLTFLSSTSWPVIHLPNIQLRSLPNFFIAILLTYIIFIGISLATSSSLSLLAIPRLQKD